MLIFFVDECFDWFGSYDFQKNVYLIKPFEEIKKINKKIALLETTSTKKRSTRSSVYYDGYGNYDCPKNSLRIKPLKEVEKNKKKNALLENLTTQKMSTG